MATRKVLEHVLELLSNEPVRCAEDILVIEAILAQQVDDPQGGKRPFTDEIDNCVFG